LQCHLLVSIANRKDLYIRNTEYQSARICRYGKMALEAYSIYAGDDKEDVLYMIQDRGIYYWDVLNL
jgi:hypothetical protein